jgi:hypothetical protein
MGRTEIGPIGTGHTGLENRRMLRTGMEGESVHVEQPPDANG